MLSDQVLKHTGVRGMRWGVRRDRSRPGGADGTEESVKVKDTRSKLSKTLDSMKRERQWKTVLKEVDKLSTTDITVASKRINLENDLKSLAKTKGVGGKKDKDDYLRREHMSDAELNRKVVRLRAKKGLHKAVKDATKEQRDFGEKVVRIGSSVGVKYALNRSLGPKDLFKAALSASKNPKNATEDAKKSVLEKVTDPSQKDILKNILDKIDKPKT